MTIICYILINLAVVLFMHKSLTLFQQNHYHLSFFKKFFKILISKKSDILVFCSLLIFKNNFLNIFCIIGLILYLYFYNYQKYIVRLKFTKRVIRLIFVLTLFIVTHEVLFGIYGIIFLSFLYLFIAYILLYPVEMKINERYIKKAKNLIKESNPLKIVITGSAGKSSVKYFLYQILSNYKSTFMTPKSYNTPLGISKAINSGFEYKTEIAIFEFGASHVGDIDKLINFIKPDIGIITNILPQHLETFKKIENIITEKLKVFEASDVCIYNSDIISSIIKKGKKEITISQKKYATYKLSDIKYNNGITSFKINNVEFNFKLPGVNNLENVVLAIITANYLGISLNNISNHVPYLKPLNNRLEIKFLKYSNKNIKIIDDSFSSNIKGFINALEVLENEEGNKTIITPGIVEGGKKSRDLNSKISEKMVLLNAKVNIVKSKVTKEIINVFNKLKFNNYEVFNNFNDAYDNALKDSDVILIENDIPDIYKI